MKIEEDIQTVEGILSISVDVECPKCGEIIDLMKIDRFMDGGYLLDEVLSGVDCRLGCDDLGDDVMCPECRGIFIVGEIVW